MYQKFFKFNTLPFSLVPDPHFMYMSDQHKEGLAHLLYGINHGGGFSALTGEVGTGKTTLCHCLLEQLPGDIDIALVFNPKLNTLELLASICDELQITYDKDHLSLKSLTDSLNQHLLTSHANGKRTVLIIDEAQNLSLDVLEQIRLLTNLETSQTKLLQIILIGQPELKQLLEKPELRQLNQRITARYHLSPLSYLETKEYINHRLIASGGTTDIFKPSAIKRIYKLSNGIPRIINIICDKALLGAYSTGVYPVTVKIVNQAAGEVHISPDYSTGEFLLGIGYGLILVAVLAIIPYYFFIHQPQKKSTITAASLSEPEFQPQPQPQPQQQQKKEHISLPTTQVIPAQLKDKPSVLSDSPLFLEQQSLNTKISQLATIWGNKIPIDSGCKGVEASGLKCLFGKTNWKDLIALNRPVILEFSIPNSEKRYVLLSGLKDEHPVFQFSEEKNFSLKQMLTHWDGYYLMLWKTPIQNGKTIYPGQSSRGVFWVRKQLSLIPNHSLSSIYSATFSEELKAEIKKFQTQHNLNDDGLVGAKTFIHLQNISPNDISPKLKLIK